MPSHSIVVPVAGGESDIALQAAALASIDLDLPLVVVGNEDAIHRALLDLPYDAERLRIVDADAPLADAVVLVANDPTATLLCADGAAVLPLARATLPPLHPHAAPALATIHPTLRHRGRHDDPFALILDIGATPHPSAADLVQFCGMGAAWARDIARTERPRVALLTSALPPEHRLPAQRDAHEMLAHAPDLPFDYLGTILADEVLSGTADVIVCDARAGDILVRTLASFATSADALVDRARERFQWRVGMSMLLSGIDRLRTLTDWENYGGAPLLGYDRLVLTLPPTAGPRAWGNAFRLVRRAHRNGTLDHLRATRQRLP
jgi:glycerol-3-phosphate acyltransferase PlsX